jgi:hypothetical protein
MRSLLGRASAPADLSGTGFQPVLPHRQDAGATKNFSRQKKGGKPASRGQIPVSDREGATGRAFSRQGWAGRFSRKISGYFAMPAGGPGGDRPRLCFPPLTGGISLTSLSSGVNKYLFGPLTQSVEYLPFKQRVVGSNPTRPTIRNASPSSSLVQDTGLSRRQHRFKSGWGRHMNSRG